MHAFCVPTDSFVIFFRLWKGDVVEDVSPPPPPHFHLF
jgi:hypothetical protein